MQKLLSKINHPIKFKTYLPNFIMKLSKNIYKNFINSNKTTKLHRWCHATSDIYKYKCNWKTKLDNANRDNSFN
tara:strand:+ start:95 stop:316 length:222 start_codon:yes stop_codon:yes gene_type:complete